MNLGPFMISQWYFESGCEECTLVDLSSKVCQVVAQPCIIPLELKVSSKKVLKAEFFCF